MQGNDIVNDQLTLEIWQISRAIVVKLQLFSMGASHTPPLTKFPLHTLVAVRVLLTDRLAHGQLIMAVRPISVSGHSNTISKSARGGLDGIMEFSTRHPSEQDKE